MKTKRLTLGLVLFALGLVGVFSILTMEISLPEEVEKILLSQFSPTQIKLLMLINPTIMLAIAVIVGVLLYEKVNLRLPIIERIVRIVRKEKTESLSDILQYGIAGGVIAGILLILVGVVFYPVLPEAFVKLGQNFQPSLPARFLYGGITEEILMRFGLMTLAVWSLCQLFKKLNSAVYWSGILIAALIFAVGHFPIVYQAVEAPSATLLTYVVVGNTIGGIIFGWLYWKKGLESAFIAHMSAHVVVVLSEPWLP